MLKNRSKTIKQMIKQLPLADQEIFRDPEMGKAIIDSTIEAFRNGVSGPAHEMKLLFNSWGFDLGDIKFPITIWHGSLDAQAPLSHAMVYARLVPGSQLRIVENEGHYSLLKNHIKKILKSVCSDG